MFEAERSELKNEMAKVFNKVREDKPLIHHITNYVVMNETANMTLCAGALPVMAHAREEVEEMVSVAGALVLNIGTLSPEWIEAMVMAGKKANELGIPVVLDPVGVGATSYRNRAAAEILENVRISVIRGNGAEVSFLAGAGGEIRGVESVSVGNDLEGAAMELARQRECVVCVTGKRDLITDGKRTLYCDNGHYGMAKITGTGCMATTLIACMCAATKDPILGAVTGLAVFGIAGEKAAEAAGDNPGTFHVLLYDKVHDLNIDDVRRMSKVDIASERIILNI